MHCPKVSYPIFLVGVDAKREVAAEEEMNIGNQCSGQKNRGVPGAKYGDFLLDWQRWRFAEHC